MGLRVKYEYVQIGTTVKVSRYQAVQCPGREILRIEQSAAGICTQRLLIFEAQFKLQETRMLLSNANT